MSAPTTFTTLLPQITTHWFWLGAAIFFAIHEVLLGGSFLFLWLGAAALLVFLVVWFLPFIPWEQQWLLFGLTALMSLVLWRYFLKRASLKKTTSGAPGLNQRGEQYVGRRFVLTSPIQNGYGILQIDDVLWRIQGADLPTGITVLVIKRVGLILKVQPVQN